MVHAQARKPDVQPKGQAGKPDVRRCVCSSLTTNRRSAGAWPGWRKSWAMEAATASSAEAGLEAGGRAAARSVGSRRAAARHGWPDRDRAFSPACWHSAPIVIITAYGDLATAVETVRRGAFEYLVKPFDLAIWPSASSSGRCAGGANRSNRENETPRNRFHGRTGSSGRFRRPLSSDAGGVQADRPGGGLRSVRPLAGESGTGKELIARAIHQFSRRQQGRLWR